jgi:photosystem II stability/assembly factor-like uncharacterized protein
MKVTILILFALFLNITAAQNIFSQWVQQPQLTDQSFYSISFINQNTGWIASERLVFRTTNAGVKWDTLFVSTDLGFGFAMNFFNNNTGYLADFFGGLYKTSNSGTNWSRLSESNIWGCISSYFINSDTGFTGTLNAFYKTTDGGSTFTPVNITPHRVTQMFFLNKTTGWTGNADGIINKTTDAGVSFTPQYNFSNNIYKIFFSNETTGYASVATQGLYKTTNGGANWNLVTNQHGSINSVAFINSETGWACSSFSDILKTTNGGANWLSQLSIPKQAFFEIQYTGNNTLWAAGQEGLLAKTTNGGALFIQQSGNEIPQIFSLAQNYPNPFNPNTVISFQLPIGGFVKLKVFDLPGKEIANLVNENLSAGKYKYDFNASLLPSGIYFYKLETENFSETRKMMLIK